MFPPLDVGPAIGALAIANWQINNLQAALGGPEQQVKITEGSKSPK